MPRPYTLGQREVAKADTRARIVEAAAGIYRERGLAGASTLAIARAADVAPATVRNHFPGPADLSSAVADWIIGELRVPGPEIFDGLDGIADRIRRLAVELAAFSERGESWWQVYQRDPGLVEAWAGAGRQVERDVEALMRTALGPLGEDDRALAVVATVVGPAGFYGFRGRGITADEAADLGVELVVPWLERRLGGDRPLRGPRAGIR